MKPKYTPRVLKTFCLVSSLIMFSIFPAVAQNNKSSNDKELDDLSAVLTHDQNETTSYTTGTFKATRIANSHSIENLSTGVLDFRVSHRFGALDNGISEFFGLDNATTRIGFDYGITDWLMTGIGRSTLLKEFDGFLKAKILRQTSNNSMPVSLSYVGALSYQKNDISLPTGVKFPIINRFAYMNQLLIARKISTALSLQLMPTHLHYNFVTYNDEPNDVISIGAGGRLKLSKRLAVTAEYFYNIPGQKLSDSKNALTVGLDIETGGHVFQLLFSNANSITERMVIGNSSESWDKGQIHFGFNISRVFTIVKPRGFENNRNSTW